METPASLKALVARPIVFGFSPALPRTSRTRGVACLARELAFHEEDRATMTHYVNCVRGAETERWRRMRPSTRTIFFRQHSCFFGVIRERRWHGLVTALQRDVLGGSLGWVASFRVYVTTTIPAGHPEMYRRGTTCYETTAKCLKVKRPLLTSYRDTTLVPRLIPQVGDHAINVRSVTSSRGSRDSSTIVSRRRTWISRLLVVYEGWRRR